MPISAVVPHASIMVTRTTRPPTRTTTADRGRCLAEMIQRFHPPLHDLLEGYDLRPGRRLKIWDTISSIGHPHIGPQLPPGKFALLARICWAVFRRRRYLIIPSRSAAKSRSPQGRALDKRLSGLRPGPGRLPTPAEPCFFGNLPE
jgi:hypothetical protein